MLKVCVWIFVAVVADKMPSKQLINAIRHIVYIQDSKLLLSALLDWLKLVQGPFGQSNMHRTLDFCSDQP